MKKDWTLSRWKKELDRVFSIYIRQRDNGRCYTCGLQKDWKEMQNGHFTPRQYLATRFDERNCHCQCYACNMLYNGQPTAYATRLIQDYGEGIIKEFEQSRHKVTKLDINWYKQKVQEYEERINR